MEEVSLQMPVASTEGRAHRCPQPRVGITLARNPAQVAVGVLPEPGVREPPLHVDPVPVDIGDVLVAEVDPDLRDPGEGRIPGAPV